MDRRSLLFILAMLVTLFLVNTYFDRQSAERRKEWEKQQSEKHHSEISHLKQEIKDETANPSQLPLATLYADKEEQKALTTGVAFQDSFLSLAWTLNLPQTVYVKGQSYLLSYAPDAVGEPVLYQREVDKSLPITDLPQFGHFYLQLIVPTPENSKQPFKVLLGTYQDGAFSMPFQELQKLEAKMGEKKAPEAIGNALVLRKTDRGYLPVAYYRAEFNSLLTLEQVYGLRVKHDEKEHAQEEMAAAEPSYYVLENDYLQLVFSDQGGALAEINLPFQTAKNKKSVVKEIEFDREIKSADPKNDLFPSNAYYTPGASPKGPFEEHDADNLGGYYPLLRRDLLTTGNQASVRIPPSNYALNFVSEYPEISEIHYQVTHFDSKEITFEAKQQNRKIRKIYRLQDAPYCFDLKLEIDGSSRGLWITSGVPEVEWISNASAPTIKYRLTRNNKPEVLRLDLPKETVTLSSISPDWVCNSNGFFGIILDPLSTIEPGFRAQAVSGASDPSRLLLIDPGSGRFTAEKLPGYLTLLPLPAKGGKSHFRIYAGPLADSTLKSVDALFTDSKTGYNPDFTAAQTFHGWFAFISAPFAKFLFFLMKFFYALTNSWGFSIILLTIALRVMLYPLNSWSTHSMLKMQQVAPEVAKIQERYKKDSKKAQLEIMNLYREQGVNPISGCFPMLIQMPFLIGMFDLLKSTFELRGASFIPGWIDNLAAPDVLFSWQTPIFFIGNQFHLLPFLLGFVMFLQQNMMSPLPKDRTQWTEQQRQQRMMGNIMTVVFAIMFYHFPSGLNIYWLSSMLLGILQQIWTTKRLKLKMAKF